MVSVAGLQVTGFGTIWTWNMVWWWRWNDHLEMDGKVLRLFGELWDSPSIQELFICPSLLLLSNISSLSRFLPFPPSLPPRSWDWNLWNWWRRPRTCFEPEPLISGVMGHCWVQGVWSEQPWPSPAHWCIFRAIRLTHKSHPTELALLCVDFHFWAETGNQPMCENKK